MFGARTAALCLALLGLAPSVGASSAFPQRLAELTGAQCAPACVTCHRERTGGLATVRVGEGGTRFGEAMLLAGLTATKADSVEPALARLRAEKRDSDLDGTLDVDELTAGTDPSQRGEPLACGAEYGCTLGGDGGFPFVVTCALVWSVTRRRARRRLTLP